jgi:DNA-binding transcriptional ArsR family regulator
MRSGLWSSKETDIPRVCTICRHEGRFDIDAFLVDRSLSYRAIARQFGVSKDAVSRHVSEGHISKLLTLAADAQRAAQADTLLDRMEALHRRVEAFLSRVEKTDNYSATLGAFRELRTNLELIGEITKELDRTPTLNLHLNPEWIELRTVIVRALEPHPEARESFLQAIEGVGNGHNTS